MTQMNLLMKQKQNRDLENRLVVAKGAGRWETIGVGVWDQQMQTGVHGMDKQQGSNAQHRERSQQPVINPGGKSHEKECIHVCESLCYTVVINTTL